MPRVFAFLALLAAAAAAAQPPAADALPPALKDWVAWSLKDLDYRACPFLAAGSAQSAADFVCAWPGRLTLAATGGGANFSIRWRVDAPSWIALPGDGEHWPQQVTVNGQRQPVLLHAGRPALWLAAGTADVAGRLVWRERPQSLSVPPGIGLVALSVDGKPVAPLQRDGDQVTLGRVAAAAPEADSIDLRVYRKLADGVPAQLETRIVVAVSGQAREEVVGPALPPGFAPVALASDWPARMDGDGRLHVQVQPGGETLSLTARATEPLATVAARLPAAPWPKQEIWSYEAAPRLRVTVATSTVQIDPRQADVPGDWQALPAFALADGGRIAVEERSRGLAADEASRLTLQREAWLDFSGDGWYARDRLSGTMATGWRFDVAPPYALERAAAQNSLRDRSGEALLVTRGARPGWTGVEWRTPHVDLAAGARIAAPAAMPVAGWQQTFDSVQATLHFPFGYKLLAAPGADSAGGSWAAGWSLLDVFVCAIAVLLAWRLLGVAAAFAAAAFLLLGYQEAGAPFWTLIAAAGLALAARALPEGRLLRWAHALRRGALLLLVLVALPFVADEVRFALYPQLEGGYAGYGVAVRDVVAPRAAKTVNAPARADEYASPPAAEVAVEADQAMALSTPAPPPAPQSKPSVRSKAELKSGKDDLDSIVVTGSRVDRSQLIDHYAETTVVQTGGGAPAWSLGSTAWLSWSGPVLPAQDVRLLIAPPWVVRPLRIVLAALLVWLVWRLFRAGRIPHAPRTPPLAAALVFAMALVAPSAHAQAFPSPELLQQVRQRLSEAPKCAPACASVAEAQVSAAGDDLAVALEVHAGERVAVPLPDDPAAASLKAVRVDGAASDAVARDARGVLLLALDRGVHRVELAFDAPGDKVALAFPLPPARVLFQGRGWDASGLADERLLTQTLALARAHAAANAAAAVGVQQFPPYVRVTRSLSLGLQWSATATVERLSPAKGGFTVDVPLIAGEHVGTAGIKVQDGKAQVPVGDDAAAGYWNSTLDKADTLALTAPALADRAEVWTVLVSPTWHVEFSGVPAVARDANENPDDFRSMEFHPLPGETLTLTITRPEAAQGAARAIDAVTLTTEAGQRAATHELTLRLRASQGGEQAILLPRDAEVLAVSRDGVALNLRALDGKLSLPVAPGEQNYDVRLRSADGAGFSVRTPPIALGMPAANVQLALRLPADRWLLATSGPPVGPAVLYWGELAVMIGVAWALSRTRRTRLRFRDWLLLGAGFSTFSWVALLVVVAWLFAIDWRARAAPPARRWAFNALQAGLVLLTVVAMLCLAAAIPQGLLGQPDMHVTGYGSSAGALHWFADRSTDALPDARALSLPLWVYKALMLAWALWLANALIGWLRAALAAWLQGGYWRGRPANVPAAAAAADAAATDGPTS